MSIYLDDKLYSRTDNSSLEDIYMNNGKNYSLVAIKGAKMRKTVKKKAMVILINTIAFILLSLRSSKTLCSFQTGQANEQNIIFCNKKVAIFLVFYIII